MAELKVIIGADSSEVSKEINKVEKELKKLEAQKQTNIKLGVDTAALDKNIATAKTKLDGLKTSMATATNATTKFNAATANGGNTLMQFSRIAQDAPFGIMGIGNNITATAEAFGNLSKSSGGAGNALKAVASSMLGTGGILLAVSLVTTALTYMSQNGITVGDVFDKLTGKFDAFGNALKKASEEAVKSTAEEVISLKSLIAIAKDEAISKRERLAAVDEIQKRYPGYFGNLSKEQIMTTDLTNTVNDLTKALINREIAGNLAKEAAPQLLALYKLNAVYKKQRAALTEQNRVVREAIDVYGENSETAKEAIATQEGLYNQMEKTRGEIYKATQVNKRYQDSIDEINKSTSKLLITAPPKTAPTKATKATKAEKPKPKDFDFGGGFMPSSIGFFPSSGGFTTALQQMDIVVSESEQKAAAHFNRMKALSEDFVTNFNTLVSDSIVSGLGNLGTSIGEALATGGDVLKAAGNSILQTMSQFLGSLGDQLIALGTAAVLTGTVLDTIGTISGIGAGLAAIAGGIAVKAIAGAMSSSAKKGMQSGGNSSTSGGDYSSPSSTYSSGSSASFTGGTVVFEISGQALVGVLSNTLDKNVRLGGNLGI